MSVMCKSRMTSLSVFDISASSKAQDTIPIALNRQFTPQSLSKITPKFLYVSLLLNISDYKIFTYNA